METAIAALAVAATLGIRLVDVWERNRQRTHERTERRTDAALEVIGPLYALLSDAHPGRFTLAVTAEQSLELRLRVVARWIEIRDSLYLARAVHPDPETRDATTVLAVKVTEAMSRSTMFAEAVMDRKGQDPPFTYDEAVQSVEDAQAALDEWAARLRGE